MEVWQNESKKNLYGLQNDFSKDFSLLQFLLPMSWGRQGDEAQGEANLGYKFLWLKKNK